MFLRGFWWNIMKTVGIGNIRITVLQSIPILLNVLDICLLLSLLQVKLHMEPILVSLIKLTEIAGAQLQKMIWVT